MFLLSRCVLGSYARGDYNAESDIDIMILLDLSDRDIKDYRHQLSDVTFDFNMGYDMEIKPLQNKNHRSLSNKVNRWFLCITKFAIQPSMQLYDLKHVQLGYSNRDTVPFLLHRKLFTRSLADCLAIVSLYGKMNIVNRNNRCFLLLVQ